MNTLIWQENQQQHQLAWRNESSQKPPLAVAAVTECSADAVLKNAHARTATLWRGDFHNAKHVLAAMKKRLRKPEKHAPAEASRAFHSHRMKQAQQSALLNLLAIEIGTGLRLNLPRAPDVRAALLDVYGQDNSEPFLLPLNQLLGFIGAHEWHKTGVAVPVLAGKIHVPFGVFSPLRGEYLELVAQAPLPSPCRSAFDIGTGSGVLAAILAQRGVPAITATDTNLRAIACARDNLHRLGLLENVHFEAVDLFPEGRADLIVCNPPWLPAKPTSAIESALYDPDSAMLKGFLNHAAAHLSEHGEVWLIISDLAEHLGLRAEGELVQWINRAGLVITKTHAAKPKHAKAANFADPLAFARSRETTFLYCLKKAILQAT